MFSCCTQLVITWQAAFRVLMLPEADFLRAQQAVCFGGELAAFVGQTAAMFALKAESGKYTEAEGVLKSLHGHFERAFSPAAEEVDFSVPPTHE